MPRVIRIEIRKDLWGYLIWGVGDNAAEIVLSKAGTLRGAHISAARWAKKARVNQITLVDKQ